VAGGQLQRGQTGATRINQSDIFILN